MATVPTTATGGEPGNRGAAAPTSSEERAAWPSRVEAVLSFPPFRLDLADERLWKEGQEVRLRRKPFAILRYLAQNPHRLVTHAELVEAVWGKVATSESLLRTHLHDLRRALGADVIETVLGRGYRFVADIDELRIARSTHRAGSRGPGGEP